MCEWFDAQKKCFSSLRLHFSWHDFKKAAARYGSDKVPAEHPHSTDRRDTVAPDHDIASAVRLRCSSVPGS